MTAESGNHLDSAEAQALYEIELDQPDILNVVINLKRLASELEQILTTDGNEFPFRTSSLVSGGHNTKHALLKFCKTIIKMRIERAKYFPARDLFGEPGWDMLLDAVVARITNKPVSITSICIASQVPPTTALRWINILIEQNFVTRTNDPTDKRRSLVWASDKSVSLLLKYYSRMVIIVGDGRLI